MGDDESIMAVAIVVESPNSGAFFTLSSIGIGGESAAFVFAGWCSGVLLAFGEGSIILKIANLERF